jgi:hypothetical protein
MSRRENCWDNTPQESFFGHFKDEAIIKPCSTFEELKKEIRSYIKKLYDVLQQLQISMEFKEDDPCSIQRSSP